MLRAFCASQFTCYSGVYAYIISDYSHVSSSHVVLTYFTFHALFSRGICARARACYIYKSMLNYKSNKKKKSRINKSNALDSLAGTFH